MTPGESAARYRGYAARCCIVAQRQDNTSDKLALIAMAQSWVRLADRVEDNKPSPAPREVSESRQPAGKNRPEPFPERSDWAILAALRAGVGDARQTSARTRAIIMESLQLLRAAERMRSALIEAR
jgi:hypothetical protein